MTTKLHFINVGQGNMTLIELSDGKNFLYDCNVTNENEGNVLEFIANKIGKNTNIDVFYLFHTVILMFICVKLKRFISIFLSRKFGIVALLVQHRTVRNTKSIWIFDVVLDVENLSLVYFFDLGDTRLDIMSSINDNLANNANAQSIVIKVVHRDNINNKDYASVLLQAILMLPHGKIFIDIIEMTCLAHYY